MQVERGVVQDIRVALFNLQASASRLRSLGRAIRRMIVPPCAGR